jgi:hypothetical protein
MGLTLKTTVEFFFHANHHAESVSPLVIIMYRRGMVAEGKACRKRGAAKAAAG